MADSPRINELRRRLQADPGSVAFAALAEEYRRSGRIDAAIETCRAGLALHPSYASAHVTLARALAHLGRPAEACPHFEQALQLAPENLVAARSLAETLKELGKAPEALARFRQALALAPGDPELQAEVATLEAQVGPATAAAPLPSPPPPGVAAIARLERFLEAISRRRAELNLSGRETTGVR